jgi:hypothetical protein
MPYVNRDEAAARAAQLNRELGEQGVLDSFYVEAEESPGSWVIEKREERKKEGWLRRFFDAVTSSGGGP